ncbi:MAG: hypothetical protein ACLQU3_02980 [Limisphaerales bacterium]
MAGTGLLAHLGQQFVPKLSTAQAPTGGNDQDHDQDYADENGDTAPMRATELV